MTITIISRISTDKTFSDVFMKISFSELLDTKDRLMEIYFLSISEKI